MASRKGLLTSRLPPISYSGKRGSLKGKNCRPATWTTCFDGKKDVTINGNTFRLYTKGDSGTCLFLIHGGGFSALTWSMCSAFLYQMINCQIIAMDLRGHGDTVTSDDTNLSIETLANDVVEVINEVLPEGTPIVLIGHSLGGSVAVHAGHHPKLSSHVGLVVIDVVEGTALGALSSMQNILRSRPQTFNSIEEAIRWSVQSGQIKNITSAKISMPGQIKNIQTNESATSELERGMVNNASESSSSEIPLGMSVESISEGEEAQFKHPGILNGKYTWRIDLRATESHWNGWFKDLSKLFLSCQAQKLLLLANLDRLDTELTVAQMQGKFAVQAFDQSRGQCGHAIHEDMPEELAEIIVIFLVRNEFVTQKMDFLNTLCLPESIVTTFESKLSLGHHIVLMYDGHLMFQNAKRVLTGLQNQLQHL